MTGVLVLAWLAAFASFTWGVLRFFEQPNGFTRSTALVATVGVASAVCHVLAIARANVVWERQLLALGCFGIATALFWSAVRVCGARRLTAISERDAPTFLVREGPYGYIRHPFYASYTIFWLGGAVGSVSLGAIASGAIMLGLYLRAIRAEESKFAASSLRSEYATYRDSTGMLFPRLLHHRAR